MDYDYNRQYIQKSKTGFWVIALLTIALCGYMTYTHSMGFVDAGFKAVDSYAYGLSEDVMDGRMKSSSTALLNFIFAALYFILLVMTVVCMITKNVKILMISFLSSLILTVLIFLITLII